MDAWIQHCRYPKQRCRYQITSESSWKTVTHRRLLPPRAQISTSVYRDYYKSNVALFFNVKIVFSKQSVKIYLFLIFKMVCWYYSPVIRRLSCGIIDQHNVSLLPRENLGLLNKDHFFYHSRRLRDRVTLERPGRQSADVAFRVCHTPLLPYFSLKPFAKSMSCFGGPAPRLLRLAV
jgi:hypothetical protein